MECTLAKTEQPPARMLEKPVQPLNEIKTLPTLHVFNGMKGAILNSSKYDSRSVEFYIRWQLSFWNETSSWERYCRDFKANMRESERRGEKERRGRGHAILRIDLVY